MHSVFLGAGSVQLADGTLGGSPSGRLSAREAALFRRLAERRGEVLDIEDLEAGVWGDGRSDARRLKVLIQRLRSKIEPNPSEPRFVVTVLRQGYRLVADEVGGGDAAPAPRAGRPVATGPLPAEPIPVLVGREATQDRLQEWLFHRHRRWLTLTGVGGVGKSALLAWAHATAQAHGLTCWWVALAEVRVLATRWEPLQTLDEAVFPVHPLEDRGVRRSTCPVVHRSGSWRVAGVSRSRGVVEGMPAVWDAVAGIPRWWDRRAEIRPARWGMPRGRPYIWDGLGASAAERVPLDGDARRSVPFAGDALGYAPQMGRSAARLYDCPTWHVWPCVVGLASVVLSWCVHPALVALTTPTGLSSPWVAVRGVDAEVAEPSAYGALEGARSSHHGSSEKLAESSRVE